MLLVRCGFVTIRVMNQPSADLTHPGQRLQEAREAASLTQRELAYFAGVAGSTISRIEAGTMVPTAALKARLARLLCVRLADLWPVDD